MYLFSKHLSKFTQNLAKPAQKLSKTVTSYTYLERFGESRNGSGEQHTTLERKPVGTIRLLDISTTRLGYAAGALVSSYTSLNR